MPTPHSQRIIALVLPLLLGLTPLARAEKVADEFLPMETVFSNEQVATTSRIPRPTSKIAENVTVITSEEIALLNAHNVADVLQTVPGIQFDFLRTPGSASRFNIQGALDSTVLLLIDGVRQNNFTQNAVFPNWFPVQNIERIEIVKGAASTAWGPALGGVINIVTKEPQPDRSAAGVISGTIGTQFTSDSRGELTGSVDNLGYYLNAGNVHSDGLLPNNARNSNNTFGKLTYTLPGNGTATLGISYLDGHGGYDEGEEGGYFFKDDDKHRRTFGYLGVVQPLGHKLNLDLSGFLTSFNLVTNMIQPFPLENDETETSRGASARLTWGDRHRNLTTGMEYAHDQSKTHAQSTAPDLPFPLPSPYDRSWDRWAVYANGAYSLGPVTILPGLRYDKTGNSGNKVSWTLGATWEVVPGTVLRAYGAQGFALPVAYPDYPQSLQDVWTIQGGIETSVIPYLWLKGTYFYNSLHDSYSAGIAMAVTEQRRQGIEIDVRTTPVQGISLGAGYTYLDARDAVTGERLQTGSYYSVPPHTLKLAIRYDHPGLGCHARLIGNYVNWNAPNSSPARDGGVVWDLHLNWTIFPEDDLSPELFFSGRNLLNGDQTTDVALYHNAPRWFDGGVRFKF